MIASRYDYAECEYCAQLTFRAPVSISVCLGAKHMNSDDIDNPEPAFTHTTGENRMHRPCRAAAGPLDDPGISVAQEIVSSRCQHSNAFTMVGKAAIGQVDQYA